MKDSMMYYFKLSSKIDNEISIRLLSENGNFKMYLNNDNYADTNHFKISGDEITPINFHSK